MRGNFAMMVGQYHRVVVAERSAQDQLLLFKDATAEADPHRDVVVACDDADRHRCNDCEEGESVVEQGDGVGGRNCTVVDVVVDGNARLRVRL